MRIRTEFSASTLRRRTLLIACALLATNSLIAQNSPTAPTAPPAVTAPVVTAKEFEVVSIRPHQSAFGMMGGIRGDEYQAINSPIAVTIVQAYFPNAVFSRNQLKDFPTWITNDQYDITAKVDTVTAQAWTHMTPRQRQESARPLLQALLADRFHLKLHLVTTEGAGYELVVGKRGPKFKETPPGEKPPENAVPMQDGGMDVPIYPGAKEELTFFNTPMSTLIDWLSMNDKRATIIDKTGLTGRYDFALPRVVNDPMPSDQPADVPYLKYGFDVTAIGLELKPVKVPVQTIVIDHIERPSEN